MKKVICLLLILSSIGCASLRTFEHYEYKQLEYRLSTVGLEPKSRKNPALAGTLNILPGIGNIYLGQWGMFVVNALLWPYSVVWAIPQAIGEANVINKQETLYYYKFGSGKQELKRLEKKEGITDLQ